MTKIRKRLGTRGLILAILTAAAVVAVPAVVIAATPDGGTLTLKSHTVAASRSVMLNVDTGGLTGDKITCTGSKAIVSLASLTYAGAATAVANPTFTGCVDNLGGTDTVVANNTNGGWTVTYNDVSDSGGEVLGASGDTVALLFPQASLTVISSAQPSCQIVANPSASDTVTGTYNDSTGALAISSSSPGNPFPYLVQNAPGMTGCPLLGQTGTATIVATYKTSPILTDS